MTCTRCNGKVMRQFDEFSCLNCGAEQTPGAAVELGMNKVTMRTYDPLAFKSATAKCEDCGGPLADRASSGLCRGCKDEARNQKKLNGLEQKRKPNEAQREMFAASMTAAFTKVRT